MSKPVINRAFRSCLSRYALRAISGAVVAACAAGFVACANYSTSTGTKVQRAPLRTEQAKNFRPLRVNSIAVLPFAGTGEPAFPESLNEDFINALASRTSLEILNHASQSKTAEALQEAVRSAQPLPAKARELGKRVGAQGVLYGSVTHYQQMRGSKLGAEQLGSAGFKLWLVQPETGETLWSASYENTEQPLSENLFRLGEKMKSGMGFRSADELMRVGFNAAADELERLRSAPAEESSAGGTATK